MPIPLANLQKEIRTPQSSDGQAPNFSQYLEGPIRAAEQAFDALSKIGSTIEDYKRKEAVASDMDAANKAQTEYSQKITDLNSLLESMSGEEAVAFQGEYNKQAQKAHQDFVSKIDNIKNREIRENARNRINNFNNSNRQNTFLYFDKEKKSVRNQNFAANKQQELRLFASGQLKGPSGEAITDVDALMLTSEADFFANNRMNGVPDSVTYEQLAAYKGQLVEAAARNMVNSAIKQGNNKPYQQALDFIGKYEGKIPTETFNKIVHSYEKEALGLEAATESTDFWDAWGNPIPKKIQEFAPHLSPYERHIVLDSVNKAKQAGLSSAYQERIGQYIDSNTRYFNDRLHQFGFSTNLQKDGVTIAADSEHTATASDLFDLWADVQSSMKGGFVVKADGSRVQLNGNEAESYQRQDGDSVVYPINNDSMKKLSLQLEQMMRTQIEAENFGLDGDGGLWEDNRPDVYSAVKKKVIQQFADVSNPSLWGRYVRGEKKKPLNMPLINDSITSVLKEIANNGGNLMRDGKGQIILDKNNNPVYQGIDINNMNYDEWYDSNPERAEQLFNMGLAKAMSSSQAKYYFGDTNPSLSGAKETTGGFLADIYNTDNWVGKAERVAEFLPGGQLLATGRLATQAFVQLKRDKKETPYSGLSSFAEISTPYGHSNQTAAWQIQTNKQMETMQRTTEKLLSNIYGEKKPKWLFYKPDYKQSVDEVFNVNDKNYDKIASLEMLETLDDKEKKEVIKKFIDYKHIALNLQRARMEGLAYNNPKVVNSFSDELTNEQFMEQFRKLGLFQPFTF